MLQLPLHVFHLLHMPISSNLVIHVGSLLVTVNRQSGRSLTLAITGPRRGGEACLRGVRVHGHVRPPVGTDRVAD